MPLIAINAINITFLILANRNTKYYCSTAAKNIQTLSKCQFPVLQHKFKPRTDAQHFRSRSEACRCSWMREV